ncbi:cellulose biosynthesis protein BcsQ [Pseudomonas citronellolis]|uniref:cellulose biosynthesis protein BcsQ n=1 Tax=Pseudomonas citronellolis TaxID=53408 RepID=UPI0023E387F8|nr:cellulose biosynthesis protein BcsQ [Pseudomonas citronellolis]MDF3931315.1 cellulose biosynthesis protein BcsQ [Pseudomonas citronellolis]
MTVLALSGLRGGVGTTSMVAALGFALRLLGERVLLLDLCPRNLLRLHCNLALEAPEGWARAELDGGAWSEPLLQVVGELYLLPHGRLGGVELAALNQRVQAAADFWPQRLQQLRRHFDWILLDLPAALPGQSAPALGEEVRRLRVIEADAACHALLSLEGEGEGPLLLNRFDPISQLQRDLLLLWRERLDGRLAPQVVHRDEAMAGALAWKSPLGYYAGDSLAAQDVRSLATWCMAQWGAAR